MYGCVNMQRATQQAGGSSRCLSWRTSSTRWQLPSSTSYIFTHQTCADSGSSPRNFRTSQLRSLVFLLGSTRRRARVARTRRAHTHPRTRARMNARTNAHAHARMHLQAEIGGLQAYAKSRGIRVVPDNHVGSISASPTACPLRAYGRAGTQNDRLSEAVILSTDTPIRAQRTRRRRWPRGTCRRRWRRS